MSQASGKSEQELMTLLKEFDTPSITNVVATYPHDRETCLGLYDPWVCNWYTDQSLKCMYPDLGRVVGHVVTVVYGPPDPGFNRLGFADVLRAIGAVDKPVILCIKQDLPEAIKNKNGLAGGIMTTAMKSAGVVGVVSDGPSRDIDEIRPMKIQYMLTGVCAGHGAFSIKAINVPVSLCGMDVCPGEIVHMDENGAVKFPRDQLANVYDYACKLRMIEARKMARLAATTDVEELGRIMDGFEDA